MSPITLGAILLTMSVTINATGVLPQSGEQWFNNKHGIDRGYKSKNVREAIYTQWVDHFDVEAGTFDQRIFINDQYYTLGGPVFIYVSEHGGAEEYWLENSYITQIAEEKGGVVYAIEPRFYGTSRPTPDLSLESLKLLTIKQTIEDIADFTRFLRYGLSDFGSDKFVIFGYETGATMAVFTHQQNPGLFNGVWASGAPVVTLLNFDYYFLDIQISSASFLDDRCISIISNAFQELENLSVAGEAARITELFGLAQQINLSEEKQLNLLYYTAITILANHFEWGSDGDRNDLCHSLAQAEDMGESALEAVSSYLYPVTAGVNLDWDEAIEKFRHTSWDSDIARSGERQVVFTTCTEWSWFRTSYSLPGIVRDRFTENFFAEFCYDVFGLAHEEIIAGNQRTAADLNVNSTLQNVFFTFGGTDPFRALGITSNLNAWSPAQVIPRFGKAFELLRTIPADTVTAELMAVRENVRTEILMWIGN